MIYLELQQVRTLITHRLILVYVTLFSSEQRKIAYIVAIDSNHVSFNTNINYKLITKTDSDKKKQI